MTTYKTLAEKSEIETLAKRIKEIEATPRALIGSDEGTHCKPRSYSLYEEIGGQRYAVTQFGGANGTRCTTEEATENTEGRINWFSDSQSQINSLQRELAAAKARLRKLEG